MGRLSPFKSERTRCRVVAAWLIAAPAIDAHAAHPLISEDAGTQGRGRFELELGTSTTYDAGGRTFEFDPQLSYGVTDALDFIVRPSWFALSGDAVTDNGRRHGFGDSLVDFKWRFATVERTSFAVRAGISAPTAQQGIPGNGGTAYHALMIATVNLPSLMITGDVGSLRVPSQPTTRRDQYRISAAAIYTMPAGVKWLVNAEAQSNADAERATWPAVLLAGMIVTATSFLDVDAGWQTRLNRAAPRQVVYLGATLRW
jgi:hypothetical protein